MAITKVSTGLIEAGAASVNLDIDENTLYIDVATNRVGIGNTGPTTALDVTGTVTADGLTVDGSTTGSVSVLVENTLASGDADSDINIKTASSGGELRINFDHPSATSPSFIQGDDRLNLAPNGTVAMTLDNGGDISFYEDTGTTAKLFWDASAERLGIGNAAPATTLDVTGTVTADALTVNGNGEFIGNALSLDLMESDQVDKNLRIRANGGVFSVQTLSDDKATQTNRLQVSHTTGDISFYDTSANQGLFWDASAASLGIGTPSPAAILDCRENSTGGSTQIRVYNTDNSNTTTQTAALFLSPDSRGNGALIHAEKENADFSTSAGRDVSLVFSPVLNNTQTRAMTLDSSGNLLVGGTNTAPGAGNTVTGVAIRGGSDNRSFFSVSSNYVAAFNRNTNDGPIVEFNRDGAGVGSIASTDGTDLQIGSGNCYLRFDDATNQILPTNAAGTKRDATLDLGDSDARYKDLHASGRGFFNLYSASIADGNIMVGEGVYVGSTSGDNQIRSSSAGAGSATLYIGNAAIQVSSDQRLKTNIVDTEMNATDKLNQVRVVDFNWDDPSDTSFNNRNARGKWTGVLAQELVDVLPFAVNAPRNEEDLTIDAESDQKWLVDQAQMVPVLIKAIQELTARIATLEGAN